MVDAIFNWFRYFNKKNYTIFRDLSLSHIYVTTENSLIRRFNVNIIFLRDFFPNDLKWMEKYTDKPAVD